MSSAGVSYESVKEKFLQNEYIRREYDKLEKRYDRIKKKESKRKKK